MELLTNILGICIMLIPTFLILAAIFNSARKTIYIKDEWYYLAKFL